MLPRLHWAVFLCVFGAGVAIGGALSPLGAIAVTLIALVVIFTGAALLFRADKLPPLW